MKTKSSMPSLSDAKLRRKFKDGLQGTKREKMLFLLENRTWLPSNLFKEIIDWISRSPADWNVFHDLFPRKIELLGAYRTYDPISLKRELQWLRVFLFENKGSINKYLTVRTPFQNALIDGDSNVSFSSLQSIQDSFGYSFWLLIHQVGIQQHFNGIEGQKEYVNLVKGCFGNRSIWGYLIHKISILNEGTISATRFIHDIRQEIDELPINTDSKISLLSYLVPNSIETIEDALIAVRHSYSHSLIDLYESSIKLAKSAIAYEASNKDRELLLNFFSELGTFVDDTRLQSIVFSLSGGKSGRLHEFDEENYNSYLAEELDNKKNISKLSTANNIGSYLIASRFDEWSNDTLLLGENVCYHLNKIFTNESDCELSMSSLNRYAYVFPGLEILGIVAAVANRELSKFPMGIKTPNEEISCAHQRISYFNSTLITAHPILLPYLAVSLRQDILSRAIYEGTFCTAEFPYVNVFNRKTRTYVQEAKLYECTYALQIEDYGTADEGHYLMSDSTSMYFQKVGLRLHLYCLLKDDRVEECLNVICSEYIRNESSITIMPVQELADALDKTRRKELRGNITIPILFDIYSRHYDKGYESVLRPSVTAALSANGVKRPSQLETSRSSFDNDKLIYFLFNTCLPDVIYMTGGYSGTEDLLEERVKILQWLSKLDEDNKDSYQEHIVEVTRQIVLNARRTEVEQSKIELNSEGFVRVAEKKVRESYARFKSLLNAGVDFNTESVDIEDSSNKVVTLPKLIPDNELQSLFDAIISDLLNVYVSDKDYGLDGFLSTRIRHNVLEGELRSPLEGVRLVTQKDENGNYQFNDYWLGNYDAYSGIDTGRVNELLAKFTQSYDGLITELNERWIRIRSQGDSLGQISVFLDRSEVFALHSEIKSKDLSLDFFLIVFFMVLGRNLEIELKNLRTKIDQEIKPRALELLDVLEREIQKECTIDSLFNAISEMRVEIPRAIDRVVAWLKPAYKVSSEPLQFKDVLQISIEIAQRFNPRFRANVKLGESASVLIDGLIVPIYSDIFVIIFHNVLIHAKLESPEININGKIEENFISLSFSNRLGIDVDLERLKQNVEQTNLRFEAGTYVEFLRGKNGTGLCRVFSMIKNGMRLEPSMCVELKDKCTFELRFNLPFILKSRYDNTAN